MFEQFHSRLPFGWNGTMDDTASSCTSVVMSYAVVGRNRVTPWSPEFSLTLHPIVKHIKAKVPAWCLDDGTLWGSLNVLALTLWFVEEDGLSLGLHLI